MIIWEKIPNQKISSPKYCLRSLETPKKVLSPTPWAKKVTADLNLVSGIAPSVKFKTSYLRFLLELRANQPH